MSDNQRYCNHKTYGVGYAILTNYRRDSKDDLWMCTFYPPQVKGKSFFCTKHFTRGDEIVFIDDAEAKRLKKQPRTKTVRKKEKNISEILDNLFTGR